MSLFFNPKRSKNIFDPQSRAPFSISRSKIDLFLECPRCFYLDRRLGVGRPKGFPFTLNSAVDALLKKEFDRHRLEGIAHPLMENYGLDAVPFMHEKMDVWRHNFTGIQVLDKKNNLLVFGAVDDIWQDNLTKELIIVDYKATSSDNEVNIDDEWKITYKRQMETYQWLARHTADLEGYKVSNRGYFVYCNGQKDKEAFDARLEFDIKIIPYDGDDSWIEPTLAKISVCLRSPDVPEPSENCEYCQYIEEARKIK
jgi:CRISPR/Cas system-associated exonuclease Cas4 (RecB family)